MTERIEIWWPAPEGAGPDVDSPWTDISEYVAQHTLPTPAVVPAGQHETEEQ